MIHVRAMFGTCLIVLIGLVPLSLCSPAPKYTTQDLQDFYNLTNKDYFLGQLPSDTSFEIVAGLSQNVEGLPPVEVVALSHCGFKTSLSGKNCYIKINPRFNSTISELKISELHEECHIKTWRLESNDHGFLWKSCMVSLADRGAMDDLW